MNPPLDPQRFAALTGVSRETLERLEAYAALLVRWSTRFNLIGRNTIGDLWRRHFLDSAQLLPFIVGARNLVDLGSGAGFPGLVLAVLGAPGVELIEADGRKCAFLREAIRVSGTSAAVRHGRIENTPARPYDVVTARACAPLENLLDLADRFVGPETICLFPKGERAADELASARRAWRLTATCRDSLADSGGTILCLREVSRESARG
jgi:16S rRNA (guanine527-N7)-methyltransferase